MPSGDYWDGVTFRTCFSVGNGRNWLFEITYRKKISHREIIYQIEHMKDDKQIKAKEGNYYHSQL